MFAHMKLGTKLLLSFGTVALITLLLGISGYYGAKKNQESLTNIIEVRLPALTNLFILGKEAEDIVGSLRTLAIADLPLEFRQNQYRNLLAAKEEMDKAWKNFESLSLTTGEADLWKQFAPAWKAFMQETDKAVDMAKKIDRLGMADPKALVGLLEKLTKDHHLLSYQTLKLIYNKDAIFEGGEDHTACNAGKWLATFKSDNPDLVREAQAIAESHRRFHEAVKNIKKLSRAGDQGQAKALYEQEMLPAMTETFRHFDALLKTAKEAEAEFARFEEHILGPVLKTEKAALDLLDKLIEATTKVAMGETGAALSQGAFLKGLSLVAMIVGVALSLALGIFITKSLTRNITRLVSSLSDGAEQVAAAATQVSSASQSLAQGSSEQAASLEETSASLEEMSSMTRANADNARQADVLMEETAKLVDHANRSMESLVAAMAEVSQASQETAKIIKTIDEIAFQTNLLALNAAVEAARAGEAGAGFAVVADEVRALAMRAAEAAKTTAGLIETTLNRVKEGSELVNKTAEAFTQMAGSSGKVKELVAEIAAASGEQAQGVDQINKAVGEMNKVTQQVAANAEESASAAEELNAQSDTMKAVVAELSALVGGNANSHNGHGGPEKRRGIFTAKFLPTTRNLIRTPVESKPAVGALIHQKPDPKQIIPMEEDFKEF